jgi:homoserine O-succinyltransferase
MTPHRRTLRVAPLRVAPLRVAPLRVALLNNMPDAALQPTEAQFRDLLAEAAPDDALHLTLFTLPELPRRPAAGLRIAATYAPFEELFRTGFDGLIVTGMESCAGGLQDMPYWRSLARVVDHAAAQALPTLWSCLAAHAAALHLHGIPRHRLSAKLSGVYACARTDGTHPYTQDLPPTWSTPHSRYNTVRERDLRAHGYRILSRGDEVGVDAFAAPDLPFLFLQGHPEYDPRALLREYARDVGRAMHGARDHVPALPAGVLDAATTAQLERLIADAERARADGAHPKPVLAELGAALLSARVTPHRTPGAPSLIGAWAASLAEPEPQPRALERLAS